MRYPTKKICKFTSSLLWAGVALSLLTTAGCFHSDDGGGNGIPDDYYHWDSLGSPGMGWGTASAIVIDPSDNKPVIVFRDMSIGRPHIMKWSSGEYWIDMGVLGITFADHPSIVLDPSDNKPIVAFVDNDIGGRTHVMKWSSGTTWTDMGYASTGDSRDWFRQPSITIDPSDNKPIVAFADGVNGWRIHVKKWSSGTTWTDMGFVGPGVGYFPSIAIDPSDNKPVVAFVDVAKNERAQVMKWSSGTTWTNLGYPNTGVTASTKIVIDPSDNKPIVAFVDAPSTSNSSVQVMKWSNGTAWTNLGKPSRTLGDGPSIVIDPSDNKPIVAFRDWASPLGADVHVMKWSSGTSWVGLGWPSSGTSAGPAIAIDPINYKPIVLYSDSVQGDGYLYVAKHP